MLAFVALQMSNNCVSKKKDALRRALPDGFRDLIDTIDDYTPMLQNIIIESKKEVKFNFTGNLSYYYNEGRECWPCFDSEPGDAHVKVTYLVDRITGTPTYGHGEQTICSFIEEGWTFDEFRTSLTVPGRYDGIYIVNSLGTRVNLLVVLSV